MRPAAAPARARRRRQAAESDDAGRSWRYSNHFGLIPANLITFVHLSMFSAMNLVDSSGEFGGTATAPRSVKRCLMVGSSTAALVCLLSAAMISGGVPLGAPKPIQPAAS